MTAQNSLEILRRRARQLAQTVVEAGDNEVEIVAFRMGGEDYGIETAQLREVFAGRAVTPLPCTPAWVSGILNVRGRILTVVDLRPVFGLANDGASAASVLIVRGDAPDGSGDVALAVEEVVGVRMLAENAIEPPHALGGGPGGAENSARYVRGVTADGLALLDAAQILGDPRLVVQDE